MINQSTKSNNRTRVLVVDDHILFREGLVSLLQSQEAYEVVGEAGSVKAAIEAAQKHKPDLVLMDYKLTDGTGLEASQVILNEMPQCKVVFLTVSDEEEVLFKALRGNASGYILKNTSTKSLMQSLAGLQNGEVAISPQLLGKVVQEFARAKPAYDPATSKTAKLSRREIEVLQALANDASNQEIAEAMFISENTVKHHIRSILKKLALSDRHEAAGFARKNGFTGK